MINQQTVKSYLRGVAEKNGYTINEKRFPVMVDKFTQKVEETWQMYCPCQVNQNQDTICPCRYMREHNACRCGLYTKEDNNA